MNIINLNESKNINGLRDNLEQLKITINKETETNEEETEMNEEETETNEEETETNEEETETNEEKKEDELSIAQRIRELPNCNWIKEINLEDELDFNDFDLSNRFHKVANIVSDNETKRDGTQKRQTVILFEYKAFIPKDDWTNKDEHLYIMTMNGKIIKIGGTRNGLKARAGSYLCGHHTVERGKSGKCSATNAKIYNTFEFYLNNVEDTNIELYAYKLPIKMATIIIEDEETDVVAQTYHKYESIFLNRYKSQNSSNKYPILSDNADPNV